MTFRDEVIDAIKGQPGSLTSTAFSTGEICERQRIIKLLEEIAVDEDGCFSERMPETLIALIKGEQMIDPNDHWINNQLITPINKVVMYDSEIYDAVIGERERIIKLLANDYLHHIWLVGDGQKLHDGECSGCKTIALIKGENK